MQKSARQDAILRIIGSERVSRQDQLVDLLNRSGFEVTQASVSRDLVELGIVKVNGFYASPRNSDLSGFGVIDLLRAGDNLIVARCRSGLASAIAVKIDSARLSEIVGTIAGDDTIFIAVENASIQRLAIKKLWHVLSH
jgi:transcriptional regulator of arginine metabolism